MTQISLSQLKANPNKAIAAAADYPVAVAKRSQVKAYLIGKGLYDQLVSHLEDYIDKKAVTEAGIATGKDFEEIATELGI
ncbi:hypothetical protein A2W24_03270 [Microgenomates group bacterium RBG_16_45_19]|nr:MAG: hypothetical protein A2W24_03270 [Microgenomates group bacterium RBG_16_45_19]